jgi:hypothetical protein
MSYFHDIACPKPDSSITVPYVINPDTYPIHTRGGSIKNAKPSGPGWKAFLYLEVFGRVEAKISEDIVLLQC